MSTYAGIDVAKRRLRVALTPGGANWEIANDAAAIEQLAQQLQAAGVELTVVEATGGWEMPVVAALAAVDLAVVVANPREVRDFARALKRLAKTDKVDAAVLAEYAQRVQPQVRPLADDQLQELQALVTRRRQVVGMITAEKNRLGTARPRVRTQIEAIISVLSAQLVQLNEDIESTIEGSPIWQAKNRLLQSVPGVGPVLSMTLLSLSLIHI